MKHESLTKGAGLSNSEQKRLTQLHRLAIFGLTFDRYLNGMASAQEVRERAIKMLECGLPSELRLR